MVLIDHPQQQDDPSDGAPTPEGKPRGRHSVASEHTSVHRHRRRRRWPVLAAVATLGVLAVPPSSPHHRTVVAEVADDAELPAGLNAAATISFLSSGAPTGSIVLASAPTQVGDQQPIAPTVISGLAANGIPNVALNAYRVAAARMANSSPDCGIDWSLVAGIGRVESNHGRFRGAVLNSDGTSTPKIMGPPLNGVQFAFIRDTDGGSFDGDSSYDRAVGPMQFIPATWRAYGVDADGTGSADPFNINDAALGAAHYLCVSGGNLRTDAGQRKAVMAYNHSDSYVNEVLALARAYANGIPVADIPLVGNTTGAVPPPGAFGTARYVGGPAAPGPALGARDMTPANGPTTGQTASGGAPPASGAPADDGTGGTPPPPPAGTDGTNPQPPAQPPVSGPAPAPAPSNPGTSTGSGPAPAGPALPPAPLPGPAPAPAPVPPPPAPVPVPPPPPAPVDGIDCTHLDPLTHVKLLPNLPLCPA
jgi:membrane-bound lytic murein transglycosylase B